MSDIEKLLEIMAALRDPDGGCPWDVQQSFETIAPYTLEEAYEVADAIARDDRDDLRDELGDLLFQVVFHARMAEEAGDFGFADVVAGICDKLTRRHPHVFGTPEERARGAVAGSWERIKAEERDRGDVAGSRLDGVPLALPALKRAAKLGKRAASVGFDWPDVEGPKAKIDEELDELAMATTPEQTAEELGDLLFAVTNLARHLGVDPEHALQSANAKFESRFRGVEAAARRAGTSVEALDLEALEALWQRQKG